jgi:ketosteroid isomerase-like protein
MAGTPPSRSELSIGALTRPAGGRFGRLTFVRLALPVMLVCGGGAPLLGEQSALRQRAVLTEMRDAVNAGDARRYAAVYSPGAVIEIFGTGELRGRAAIERHEIELLAQFPGARFAFYEVWHSGDRAVAHYGVNANIAGGRSMGHEGLLFFAFDASGLIERERRYQDSLTPMAQLGALGDAPRRPIPVLPAGWQSHDARDSNAEKANVATIRALFESAHASLRSAAAENASFDELMLPQAFTPPRAAERWLRQLEALGDTRFEVASITGVGRHVLVEGNWSGVIRRQFGVLQPSPTRFSAHRAAIVELDDRGRVMRVAAFMNGKEIAESIQQWPPKQ